MATWRQLYTAAMLETNVGLLDILIEDTARAIEMRLDELKKSQDGDGERKEIADATSAMLALKADRIALNEGATLGDL
jgi:predicted PhzF superfamily epimerase YddE/YHI9